MPSVFTVQVVMYGKMGATQQMAVGLFPEVTKQVVFLLTKTLRTLFAVCLVIR
jgi:hypothetical protein